MQQEKTRQRKHKLLIVDDSAEVGGADILWSILNGMGEDGASIGQDQESSIVYGMPRKAFEIGAVEKQVPLINIAQKIVEFREDRL